jgi:hypothetical protein
MKKVCIILVASLILFTSRSVFAENRDGGSIIADALLMRPVSLASIVAGTAVFIVSLPFAVVTDDVSKSAKKLVVDPFNYTFDRPLGDFEYQTDPMLEDSPAKE